VKEVEKNNKKERKIFIVRSIKYLNNLIPKIENNSSFNSVDPKIKKDISI
jgi:hypothetical protein